MGRMIREGDAKVRVRVLVVDDSVTIRAILTQLLQDDCGIVAMAVSSVAEAECALALHSFDVITLDVKMPDGNGLDYLRLLTARGDLPVVMLSASTGRGNDIRTASLLAGAVGCFDKADAVRAAPELRELVRKAAGRRARISQEDALAMTAAEESASFPVVPPSG